MKFSSRIYKRELNLKMYQTFSQNQRKSSEILSLIHDKHGKIGRPDSCILKTLLWLSVMSFHKNYNHKIVDSVSCRHLWATWLWATLLLKSLIIILFQRVFVFCQKTKWKLLVQVQTVKWDHLHRYDQLC